ncbi:MAG: TIM barrel protein [Chloroflexota bacterium]
MTAAPEAAAKLSRLHLGSAPDSWGVWMPDDPRQTPWPRFLDEVAEAGYAWIELGPFGYLPTDPARLVEETGRRGLTITGGTVDGGLHRPGTFDEVLERSRDVCRTLAGVGARYLVFLPEMYRDVDEAGTWLQERELTVEQWDRLLTGMSQLGRIVHDEFSMTLAFHPHADSHVGTQEHVERFLEGTDPDFVQLCLDTGHVSYCDGDNIAIIRRFPERIHYVHLKQVEPGILERVRREGLSFAQAVRLGSMCEPPLGDPEMPPVLETLADLDRDLFAVVEQDLFPCEPDVPLPIAKRTREYFESIGIGPGRLANEKRTPRPTSG